MKVDNIQSTNFQSNANKKRFITNNMRCGIESLLIRMNHNTKITPKNEDYFISTIITKLKHDNGAVFEDERRLDKIVPHNEQMQGFSVLEFGKTKLDIDNESGEIIDYKKPFFKTWHSVLNKAENVIDEFRNHFYDSCVTKETLGLRKLTPEGSKKIKKLVLQTEKERLKEITAELERELSDESR